jgi:hypothetical protein
MSMGVVFMAKASSLSEEMAVLNANQLTFIVYPLWQSRQFAGEILDLVTIAHTAPACNERFPKQQQKLEEVVYMSNEILGTCIFVTFFNG